MSVLTRTPVQRIINCPVGPDASSQWEGRHTRFAVYDELQAVAAEKAVRKKWHCGTGHDRIAGMNYETAKQNNFAVISCCTPDYRNRRGKPSRRTKMFSDFKENAKQGDTLFLHNGYGSGPGRVTHWGIYTGEILSHREGYETPPPGTNPSGWAEHYGDTNTERLRNQFHLKVVKWIPVRDPFPMKKRQATLFEVTDEPTYTH
jgi:hypothetical protein